MDIDELSLRTMFKLLLSRKKCDMYSEDSFK